MERDKILTIRVNSELYNKAKSIIEENTERKYGFYTCKFSNYCWGKFSFADLFEKCLKDFVQENEKDKKHWPKSNTKKSKKCNTMWPAIM